MTASEDQHHPQGRKGDDGVAQVAARAAALFEARSAYVTVLADINANPAAIAVARKAHSEARDAYDIAYKNAYDVARRE
jgi:hypothetical protein